MKLIVGLGNPGKKYKATRHNIGFIFIDALQAGWNFPVFEFQKKFNAELSRENFQQEDIILVKPQTFMNLSGESVKKILDFYKMIPKDILVIHDDLDIAMGNFKIATNSSSAGHNGVQNIIDQLGTQEFRRIRVGIGQTKENAIICPPDMPVQIKNSTNKLIGEAVCRDAKKIRQIRRTGKIEAQDFVLEKFSHEEIEKIKSIESSVLEEVEKFLSKS